MTACRSMPYRAADGSELPLLVFEPGDGTPPRAGIVLFHGGALRTGSADGLAPHCRELASRGVFAVSAGYRLLGQGAASIDDCVADVRRAVEQVGRLAASRGLSRLASGGSSAGAHLALVAAMTAPDEPGVAAVVGLNPAGLDLRSLDPQAQRAEHGFHYPGDSGHFGDVIDATARFLRGDSSRHDVLRGGKDG